MALYEDEFPAQVRVSGHLRTLIWSVGHLWLKVQRCPMLPTHPICIKYQDENNNILGVDTSELRFGGVRNTSSSWKLVLELSSLNHTKITHCYDHNFPIFRWVETHWTIRQNESIRYRAQRWFGTFVSFVLYLSVENFWLVLAVACPLDGKDIEAAPALVNLDHK